jgi:organic radical activating enzyme
MPQPHTLKITEIFPSIQGEGLRSGEPTIFIRLTGCNLRCDFCDTKYAWNEGEDYPVEKVLEAVKNIQRKYPADWVCLTGGEPQIQPIKPLVKQLKIAGYKVQIETNGIRYQPLDVDWWTLSPKPETYGFAQEFKAKANEVKLVVSKELTFDIIRNFREQFPGRTPILLQPQSNRKWSVDKGMKLLNRSLHLGLKNIKVSVQIHKIYGLK